jgi:hypothetical protein
MVVEEAEIDEDNFRPLDLEEATNSSPLTA